MKFIFKDSNSQILKENITYKKNYNENNKKLLDMLIKEQKNFCAYTEKYISNLETVEVEHFNSSKKYNDDYYNYYAVLRKANLYKKDEKYKNATFFTNLFFQNEQKFNDKIEYLKGDFIYSEIDENDVESKEFIDFLDLNNSDLVKERKNHISRLNYLAKEQIDLKKYLENHKEELNFITIIEKEFNIIIEDL